MKKIVILLITLCFTTNIISAQETTCVADTNPDKTEIVDLITNFTEGIDKQNGEMILQTFYKESSLKAFAPDGKKLITITAVKFAKLHDEKKFGGQEREVKINNFSITDGLQASASIDAFNEKVFYNYRLTFIKQDGKWLILSMMQRSRPQINKITKQ